MPVQAAVIEGDGSRLPDGPRGLPRGRSLLAPLDDRDELTSDEDVAVRRGLDEMVAGEVVPLDDMICEIDECSRKG
jgi:hypothetical protein